MSALVEFLLTRIAVDEDRVYYWLLDRLTDNAGWRPLFYRGEWRP